VNCAAPVRVDTPMGGVKESGYAYEGGERGVEECLPSSSTDRDEVRRERASELSSLRHRSAPRRPSRLLRERDCRDTAHQCHRDYGRAAIEEILNGPRNWLWLLGTRRLGKTSLLKQLEHLTASSLEIGYVPIFWDFQGAENARELHDNFADALLDAEERLERVGISLSEVENDDLFSSLSRLRRCLRSKTLKLLLLCLPDARSLRQALEAVTVEE